MEIEAELPCTSKIRNVKKREKLRNVGRIDRRSFRFNVQRQVVGMMKIEDASFEIDY